MPLLSGKEQLQAAENCCQGKKEFSDKMDQISVIVPVYQAESYIGECIESILSQTYQNIQLILVEDGSPDRCGEICEEYAAKDNRILVLHKQNEGVSAARNDGIDKAAGNYLMFVDADDSIGQGMCGALYDYAVFYKSDLVVCNPGMENAFEVYSGTEALKALLSRERIDPVPWGKLYSRELIGEIRFETQYRFYEDLEFLYLILDRAKQVCEVKENFYHYRQENESATRSPFSDRKIQDMNRILEKMSHYFSDRTDIPKKLTETYAYQKKIWMLLQSVRSGHKSEETEGLYQQIRKSRKRAKEYELEKKYRLRSNLIQISPACYEIFERLLVKRQ